MKKVATKNALEFVTLVTLQTVSKNKVYFEVFEPINNFNPEHISHSDWGDLLVVAPSMRNTVFCILYATMKIQKRNPNAVFIVAPSDHWIEQEEEFQENV